MKVVWVGIIIRLDYFRERFKYSRNFWGIIDISFMENSYRIIIYLNCVKIFETQKFLEGVIITQSEV